MAAEVLDQAVGEDEVEVLIAEQLVGIERVAFDRRDTRETLPGLVEIHDGDMAGLDRRTRPPNGARRSR